MTSVIARPIRGSPMEAPRATTAALATTPSDTNPSTRAWLPSAISPGLSSRRPPRSRTRAAISLPTKPITPAAAKTHRCGKVFGVDQPLDRFGERHAGRDEDRQHDRQSGEPLAAGRTQEERDRRVVQRSTRPRSCGSGQRAVRRSPTSMKRAAWAPAASPSTARLIETVLMPSCERVIERSTSPCECPPWSWSDWFAGFDRCGKATWR